MMTAFVFAAILATVGSLIGGVSSMASDTEVGHLSSVQWMGARVAFQALALLLIVLALVT